MRFCGLLKALIFIHVGAASANLQSISVPLFPELPGVVGRALRTDTQFGCGQPDYSLNQHISADAVLLLISIAFPRRKRALELSACHYVLSISLWDGAQ